MKTLTMVAIVVMVHGARTHSDRVQCNIPTREQRLQLKRHAPVVTTGTASAPERSWSNRAVESGRVKRCQHVPNIMVHFYYGVMHPVARIINPDQSSPHHPIPPLQDPS
jgi:hypothetical protein